MRKGKKDKGSPKPPPATEASENIPEAQAANSPPPQLPIYEPDPDQKTAAQLVRHPDLQQICHLTGQGATLFSAFGLHGKRAHGLLAKAQDERKRLIDLAMGTYINSLERKIESVRDRIDEFIANPKQLEDLTTKSIFSSLAKSIHILKTVFNIEDIGWRDNLGKVWDTVNRQVSIAGIRKLPKLRNTIWKRLLRLVIAYIDPEQLETLLTNPNHPLFDPHEVRAGIFKNGSAPSSPGVHLRHFIRSRYFEKGNCSNKEVNQIYYSTISFICNYVADFCNGKFNTTNHCPAIIWLYMVITDLTDIVENINKEERSHIIITKLGLLIAKHRTIKDIQLFSRTNWVLPEIDQTIQKTETEFVSTGKVHIQQVIDIIDNNLQLLRETVEHIIYDRSIKSFANNMIRLGNLIMRGRKELWCGIVGHRQFVDVDILRHKEHMLPPGDMVQSEELPSLAGLKSYSKDAIDLICETDPVNIKTELELKNFAHKIADYLLKKQFNWLKPTSSKEAEILYQQCLLPLAYNFARAVVNFRKLELTMMTAGEYIASICQGSGEIDFVHHFQKETHQLLNAIEDMVRFSLAPIEQLKSLHDDIQKLQPSGVDRKAWSAAKQRFMDNSHYRQLYSGETQTIIKTLDQYLRSEDTGVRGFVKTFRTNLQRMNDYRLTEMVLNQMIIGQRLRIMPWVLAELLEHYATINSGVRIINTKFKRPDHELPDLPEHDAFQTAKLAQLIKVAGNNPDLLAWLRAQPTIEYERAAGKIEDDFEEQDIADSRVTAEQIQRVLIEINIKPLSIFVQDRVALTYAELRTSAASTEDDSDAVDDSDFDTDKSLPSPSVQEGVELLAHICTALRNIIKCQINALNCSGLQRSLRFMGWSEKKIPIEQQLLFLTGNNCEHDIFNRFFSMIKAKFVTLTAYSDIIQVMKEFIIELWLQWQEKISQKELHFYCGWVFYKKIAPLLTIEKVLDPASFYIDTEIDEETLKACFRAHDGDCAKLIAEHEDLNAIVASYQAKAQASTLH